MHFPLPRGIFVHSWVWTTKPFPLCFTVSTVALVGLAISQGPLLCPHDAAASSPYTGSTCSLSRLLLMFFLLAGGPSSLPQSNCFSSTLETQLCFVMAGFLINGWSPACSIVKSSLFQWLLFLISACILLPSGLRSSETICLLWVMCLHEACVYWAFTLCQAQI